MSIWRRISNILFGTNGRMMDRVAHPPATTVSVNIGQPVAPPSLLSLEYCALRLVCMLPGMHSSIRLVVESYLSGMLHEDPQLPMHFPGVALAVSVGIMSDLHRLPPGSPLQVSIPLVVADPQPTRRGTPVPSGPVAPHGADVSSRSSGSHEATDPGTPELFRSALTGSSSKSSSSDCGPGVCTPVTGSWKSACSFSVAISKTREYGPQSLIFEGSELLEHGATLEDLEFVPPLADYHPAMASSDVVEIISFASVLSSPCEPGVSPQAEMGRVNERATIDSDCPNYPAGDIVSPEDARAMGLIFNGEKPYTVLGVLGEGSYGRVIHARSEAEEDLAIKVFHKRKVARDHNGFDWLVAEKLIWERITTESNSPFLAPLHASFQDDANVYFVTKLYPQTLRKRLSDARYTFSLPDIKLYAAELLLAIEDLHRLFIIHRDIKPDNIVLSPSGHVCLIDYGLSRAFDNKGRSPHEFQFCRASAKCGTRGYCAPEIVHEGCARMGYNASVDIWAYGMVLLEMFLGDGQSYFNSSDEVAVKEAILSADIDIRGYVSDDEAADLLEQILVVDPFTRATIADIKSHPFFREIDWDCVRHRGYQIAYVPGYRWPKDRRRALLFDCGVSRNSRSPVSDLWVSDERIFFHYSSELLRDPGHGSLVWSTREFVHSDDIEAASRVSYCTGNEAVDSDGSVF
ncbi:kinase-like protein [Heliocybe sulcata]|uniref:Kinase-like protein n=1 Tax=Heliocybe sulcata TaxID=5364 RepID=A0A5C3MNI6_9AGAM|nr:kinase-like protein [Heliocybe sulcata]